MEERKLQLRQNWEELKKTIPPHVTLIAVSKKMPIEDIEVLYHLGQRDFGENYVQELKEKSEKLNSLKDIRWHFIGHLQTNKVKLLASIQNVVAIHSVDSEKLLKEIFKYQNQWNNKKLQLFFEMNIGEEVSKTGIASIPLLENMIKAFFELRKMAGSGPFVWAGLMGMGVLNGEKETVLAFEKLRLLKEEMSKKYHLNLQLSMGMSHDYPLAISSGSDFIRVGSLLFGQRK